MKRKKFLLAVYDDKDMIVTVFDTYYEVADFFNKTYNCVVAAVTRGKAIAFNNRRYMVYKIA